MLGRPVRCGASALLPLVRADIWADDRRRAPASRRPKERELLLLGEHPTNLIKEHHEGTSRTLTVLWHGYAATMVGHVGVRAL